MSEHVPITAQEWGMSSHLNASSLWCKHCGFLLVRSDGKRMPRADQPCDPARIELR
jgi:hypothetical protein